MGQGYKILGGHAVVVPRVHLDRHVGWHPHRGFDILSYIKQGRGSHADSMGNAAVVRPGGLQWMRTGSGVEHAEGGGNPDGASTVFNCGSTSAKMKMEDPACGTVQPEDIPEERSPGGGLFRFLVAGDRGAAFRIDPTSALLMSSCRRQIVNMVISTTLW